MDPISLLVHHQARANQLQAQAAGHRQARRIMAGRRRARADRLTALAVDIKARLSPRASQQACCA